MCVCLDVDAPCLEQGGISQPLFSRQSKPSQGVRAYTPPPPPPHPTLSSISPFPLFEIAWTESNTAFSIYTFDQQPIEHTASGTQCITL